MVTVYTKPNCSDCEKTKADLSATGIEFKTIDIFANKAELKKIKELGFRNAPVVMTDTGDKWSGYRPEKISALTLNDDDTWDF